LTWTPELVDKVRALVTHELQAARRAYLRAHMRGEHTPAGRKAVEDLELALVLLAALIEDR